MFWNLADEVVCTCMSAATCIIRSSASEPACTCATRRPQHARRAQHARRMARPSTVKSETTAEDSSIAVLGSAPRTAAAAGRGRTPAVAGRASPVRHVSESS